MNYLKNYPYFAGDGTEDRLGRITGGIGAKGKYYKWTTDKETLSILLSGKPIPSEYADSKIAFTEVSFIEYVLETKIPKFTPYSDRILVVLDPNQEEKTAGGIIVPESSNKDDVKPRHGIVVRLGLDSVKEGAVMVSKVGDRVWFSKHAGSMVKLKNGEEYAIIRDTDVWGAEEPE